MSDRKTARASSAFQNIVPGSQTFYSVNELKGDSLGLGYHEAIKRCRFYYENDSIAGTVINRMADIAITPLKNKHKKYSKEIKHYYDGIAKLLFKFISNIPLSYLIDGMIIPEYRTDKIMGNRLHQDLGRTRYLYPKALWVRNPENIILKKSPLGTRIVYLKIPKEDRELIESKGIPDRLQEYNDLITLYPEYVAAIKAGQTMWRLDSFAIYRNMTTYNTYPIPFLKNALPSLDYRRSLKRMDKATANRVLTAIRHIKVGSDEYPADDEDIKAARDSIQLQSSTNAEETIFNLYTPHTISISWILPMTDTLLDEGKYKEANSDVFLSMGFPRLWAVGENERSNSSDNKIASVGPIATLNSMRDDILVWVEHLYEELAELNGFTHYPDPYFMPISQASASELLQYAGTFLESGAISKNTVAVLYGSDYESEQESISREVALTPESENTDNGNNTETQEQNTPIETRIR